MAEQSAGLTQLCIETLKRGGSLSDIPKEHIPSLTEVLNVALGKADRPIKTIAELAGINNASIHKILHNEMHPTRNTLLRLALVMNMSFEDTQVLLKAGNRSLLSGSRERDRIIMSGIVQKQALGNVCDKLVSCGFSDLYSKQD